jgi:hypothetical protein
VVSLSGETSHFLIVEWIAFRDKLLQVETDSPVHHFECEVDLSIVDSLKGDPNVVPEWISCMSMSLHVVYADDRVLCGPQVDLHAIEAGKQWMHSNWHSPANCA